MVTGHTQDGEQLNWQALVASKTTLVIYMGIKKVAEIVRQLIEAGMDADIHAMAIQHGTLDTQRHVIAPLAMLPLAVHQEKLESPAIIVIGDVVRIANTEHLPAALEVAA